MDAPGCTMTLAKLFSRKAVIADLKAAGIKPSTLSYADVSAQPLAYCEAHREAMIAKALWAISRSPVLRRIAEQERKRRLREKGSAQRASTNPHGMGLSERQR